MAYLIRSGLYLSCLIKSVRVCSCHPSSVILCDSKPFTHRGPSGCNKSKPQILTAKSESLQLILELNPLYSIGFLTGLLVSVSHTLEVPVVKETE